MKKSEQERIRRKKRGALKRARQFERSQTRLWEITMPNGTVARMNKKQLRGAGYTIKEHKLVSIVNLD